MDSKVQHNGQLEQQQVAPALCKRKRGPQVLLGVTGSVATVKSTQIAVQIARQLDAHVKILLTAGAKNFWEPAAQHYNKHSWAELQTEINETQRIEILHSEDEWRSWNRLGDPVMHIELRDWADCLVFAPLSAHTLAKLANGFCDDALSSVARAWEFGDGQGGHHGKPMVLAPAMNTYMWEHPLTQQQLSTVQNFFVSSSNPPAEAEAITLRSCPIVQPQVKTLACGQEGNGALAPVSDIVGVVGRVLNVARKTE